MKKSYAMKWIAALRSGKYKQGKGALHQVDRSRYHKYCCLGVLCEVVGVERTLSSGGSFVDYTGAIHTLPAEVIYITEMEANKVFGTFGDWELTALNNGICCP